MQTFHQTEFETSALSFPVKELIPHIQDIREKYTLDGAAGMEPHFTAHFPFVTSSDELSRYRQTIQQICRSIPPFTIRIRKIDRFPNGVIYLKPESDLDTDAVMKDCAQALPDYPPYHGTIPIEDLHSHITLATIYEHDQRNAVFAEIESRLHAVLPISAKITTLNMYVKNSGRWYFYESFPIGI
jgi:2'-5' RNA ligase